MNLKLNILLLCTLMTLVAAQKICHNKHRSNKISRDSEFAKTCKANKLLVVVVLDLMLGTQEGHMQSFDNFKQNLLKQMRAIKNLNHSLWFVTITENSMSGVDLSSKTRDMLTQIFPNLNVVVAASRDRPLTLVGLDHALSTLKSTSTSSSKITVLITDGHYSSSPSFMKDFWSRIDDLKRVSDLVTVELGSKPKEKTLRDISTCKKITKLNSLSNIVQIASGVNC